MRKDFVFTSGIPANISDKSGVSVAVSFVSNSQFVIFRFVRGCSGIAAIKPAEALHPVAFTPEISTLETDGVSSFTGRASKLKNSGSQRFVPQA